MPPSRNQGGSWRADAPYAALPLLPPAEALESVTVLRRVIQARVALAELKQAAGQLADQAMLIAALPLLEAQASSEIENIVTTADELFRSLSNIEGANAATREALRYREALLEGFRSLAQLPLGTRSAEAIASRIKGVEMRVRQQPGTTLRNDRTGEVIYTPPENEGHLRDLLANWERFMHTDDALDPLVRMAVGHYQFEAIHPFADGNGRTGRILNVLFLVERGLIDAPVLYLSRTIIANKTRYYETLLGVTRRREWEPWLFFMMEAVEQTARWTFAKVMAIRNLRAHTEAFVRERSPRSDSQLLLDLIFERPYCRIADVVARGIAQRQAASTRLHALVDLGVLRAERHGREWLFLHPRLLRILTSEANDFAPYG
jgi:Fic family protein